MSLGTAEAPPPTATAQLPPGPAMPPPQQQLPQMPLLSETPALNQNPSGWTEEEVSMLNGLQGQFSNLRVRKLIDEGASSQVWEGEWAGARVVIKVLREQEALRSFLSEVRRRPATAPPPPHPRLHPSHPHVPLFAAAGQHLAPAAPPVRVRPARCVHVR